MISFPAYLAKVDSPDLRRRRPRVRILVERLLEDGVANRDRRMKNVDGEDVVVVRYHLRPIAGDDEKRKDDGENTAGNDQIRRHGRQYRQRQSEAEKIRPMRLDVGESAMQFEPLIEPLVFEAVERVEQTQVDDVGRESDGLDRQKAAQLALDEEKRLDDEAEDGVGDHHAHRGHHAWSAARRLEGGIGDVLEPDGVHDLAEKEERDDPKRREGEGEDGLRPRPKRRRRLREEEVEKPLDRRQ